MKEVRWCSFGRVSGGIFWTKSSIGPASLWRVPLRALMSIFLYFPMYLNDFLLPLHFRSALTLLIVFYSNKGRANYQLGTFFRINYSSRPNWYLQQFRRGKNLRSVPPTAERCFIRGVNTSIPLNFVELQNLDGKTI